jgi:FixJ family two-component response regulator
MSEEQTTVHVIDDDPSVRDAITGMLSSIGLQVRAFASAQEFLYAGLPEGPNCLVLDVRLPGSSGLEFQDQLVRLNIHVPIVFITGFADIPMTVRAMKGGAVEFLTKPFRDQDLLDAIQHALEGDRTARRMRTELAQLQQRFDTLTDRERQVMAAVLAGKLSREIAAELGTSEITVKVQRSRIMRKLGADSLIELVRIAERLNQGAPK